MRESKLLAVPTGGALKMAPSIKGIARQVNEAEKLEKQGTTQEIRRLFQSMREGQVQLFQSELQKRIGNSIPRQIEESSEEDESSHSTSKVSENFEEEEEETKQSQYQSSMIAKGTIQTEPDGNVSQRPRRVSF